MFKDSLKAFLGGGSAYAYLAIAGAAIAFRLHYGHVKSERDRFESERDAARAEVLSRDAVIASQARTGERRAASQSRQADLEARIYEAPDETHCAASPALRIALDGLRERAGTRADQDTD